MSFEKILRIPNDRIAVLIGKSGGVKSKIEQLCYVTLDIDGTKLQENLSEYINRLATFPLPDKNHQMLFGIDLGFTDPTAIVINYIDRGRIYFHGRIQLTKVSYPIQEKIIERTKKDLNAIVR